MKVESAVFKKLKECLTSHSLSIRKNLAFKIKISKNILLEYDFFCSTGN